MKSVEDTRCQSTFLDGSALGKTVAGRAVAVVISIDPFQPLHLLDYLHRVLLYQSLVGQNILLLGAAVQVRARQNVRNCSEPKNMKIKV